MAKPDIQKLYAEAVAWHRQGNLEQAEKRYRDILEYAPDAAEIHNNCGAALAAMGREREAADAFLRVTRLEPNNPQAYNNLGNVLKELGDYTEAIQNYQTAIRLKPDYVAAHYHLGLALKVNGNMAEAKTQFQRVLEMQPGHANALNSMGLLLKEEGHLEDATVCFSKAIALAPASVEARMNLGLVYVQRGKWPEAVEQFYQVCEMRRDFLEAFEQLGTALLNSLRYKDAIECFERCLQLSPASLVAHLGMGSALGDQGRLVEAEASYRRALEIDPDDIKAYQLLLFSLNYRSDLSAEEIYASYRAYDARFGLPLRTEWQPHDNLRDPHKKLKIGYVCPSFYRHSTRHFLEPLLERHDKNAFEIYAYAGMNMPPDDVTKRYQGYVDHWIPTRGMLDTALAERIRADGIDILVDVAGHTEGSRLQMFARKPAPVSVHWLDFGYTTGLTAIDYYLTDQVTVPEGAEHLFSETPMRLPVPALVYRPEHIVQPSVTPCLERGYVTFGTLTRAIRINDKSIRVWSAILKLVPNARLVINSRDFHEHAQQLQMMERFAEHGIPSEQLEIGFSSPVSEVLCGVDIGLDCFPHNSGTTLIEMLYAGIPFVTLSGRPSVGTLGASILAGLGHPEWVAKDEKQYIELAVKLASDFQHLAALRTSLTAEMEQSPLMDEKGFAHAVENAYRQMWQAWCVSPTDQEPESGC